MGRRLLSALSPIDRHVCATYWVTPNILPTRELSLPISSVDRVSGDTKYVNDFTQNVSQAEFYVRPSQLEISNARLYHDPASFDLPTLENTFDGSLLICPNARGDEVGLSELSDYAFTMENFVGNSLGEAITPRAIADHNTCSIVPSEADAKGAPPLPQLRRNQLNSTSILPHLGSETAHLLVCPDCPEKPPFRHRHQYK